MSAITMSAPARSDARVVSWGRFALVGLATVVGAVLANVLVYYIAGAFVAYGPQFLPLVDVSGAIVCTVLPSIVAVLLLRFTARPARSFSIISAVVFIVMTIPDFTYIPTIPGATVAQTTVLVLMHIVAAAVIVGALTTRTRQQAR